MSDDTQTIQAWVDEQRRAANPRRALDARTYVVSDTIRIGKSMALALRGGGGQNRSPSAGWDNFRCGTILEWHGPRDKPVMEIISSTGLVIEGINVTVKTDAAQCVLIRDGDGSLNIVFRDVGLIRGDVGIQCGTIANEQTCANITYTNVMFENQNEAGVRLMNMQSLQHHFERPLWAFCPVAIDVQAGGDVTVLGGGTYEVGCILKLGTVSQNTRGFDINSVRVDGSNTRTSWIDAYDTDRARTYGVVSFRNCGQNNGQKVSTRPLFMVPPGCRCVADCCDFNGSVTDWCRVYSDNRAGGEFIANYCSGLDGTRLGELVHLKGPRAYYAFSKCGNLYSATGDLSSFPS